MSAAEKFEKRSYRMTAISGVDELTVDKSSGTEWADIDMLVNGDRTVITICSRSHLVMLRTMIGEALGIEE